MTMKFEEHARECNEDLAKLVGKKIIGIEFKPCDSDCWRLYITTDKDKLVMTFCRDWVCPEVEYRD